MYILTFYHQCFLTRKMFYTYSNLKTVWIPMTLIQNCWITKSHDLTDNSTASPETWMWVFLIIRSYSSQSYYLSYKPEVFTNLVCVNSNLTFHIWCLPPAALVLCTTLWPHSQCMLLLEFQADVQNQSHITLWYLTVIQEHSLVSHHGE